MGVQVTIDDYMPTATTISVSTGAEEAGYIVPIFVIYINFASTQHDSEGSKVFLDSCD